MLLAERDRESLLGDGFVYSSRESEYIFRGTYLTEVNLYFVKLISHRRPSLSYFP